MSARPERTRELANGGDARQLPLRDLLAVVVNSPDCADRLLAHCETNGTTLASISQTHAGQRRQWGRLTEGQSARLSACLELGRRLHAPAQLSPGVRGPADIARYLMGRYGNGAAEEFGFLALDSRGCVLRDEVMARGSLTGTNVHPRDLFRRAIAIGAVSLVVFHNHPSGDPEPSNGDRQLTRRLQEVGALVGIPILDHLVIGSGRWHSFSEEGEL